MHLPDNEDVGVFFGGIVVLLQGVDFRLGGRAQIRETAVGNLTPVRFRVTRWPMRSRARPPGGNLQTRPTLEYEGTQRHSIIPAQ